MDDLNRAVAQLLASLPQKERAERYREYAARAVARAQRASNSEQRIEYFTIAANWHTMAAEIERALAGELPGDVPAPEAPKT